MAKSIKLQKLSLIEKFMMALVLFILITTLVITLYYPPNNWDSMSYHLSRVFFWMQNHSINHYATSYEQQITLQPLAEFMILHSHVLAGTDRLAGLVQWFSYAGALICVSLIARELNASRKVQIASMVIASTLPMAILQASSTQNDMVVSFFILCFIYFILRLTKIPDRQMAIFAGISLGLALLTKGTAYIFVFPFLVLFIIMFIRPFRLMVYYSIIIASLTLIINSGHLYRNLSLYQHPFGGEMGKLSNELYSVPALLSNISRNLSLHLMTPAQKPDLMIIRFLENLHHTLGIAQNDTRTTFGGNQIYQLPNKFIYHEDRAQNFFHMLLILIGTTVFFIAYLAGKRDRNLLIYVILAGVAFLLFCFLLKWQIFHSRLHLPWFLLFAPACATILSKVPKLMIPVLIILVLFAMPVIFKNQSRPLISKDATLMNKYDKIFINRPKLKVSYRKTTDLVRKQHYRTVGLLMWGDDWDYPLCNMIMEKVDHYVEIRHVNVTNPSGVLEDKNFRPECVIATHEHQDSIVVNSKSYKKGVDDGIVSIYLPK